MCIHNLSCHAFTHRADQASRTCNNNTTGYRRVPNFPPSESLPSTVMHPFPKSPPQNQPRLAPAGRPGGLADRPGVKTAHRCVACHQVYLPDFERKARVGVRAQPARNHFAAELPPLADAATAIRLGWPPSLLDQGGGDHFRPPPASVDPKSTRAHCCQLGHHVGLACSAHSQQPLLGTSGQQTHWDCQREPAHRHPTKQCQHSTRVRLCSTARS